MTDDDKPDFLKDEDENDPAKVQKEYMEFAKGLLKEMKEDKERKRIGPPVFGSVAAVDDCGHLMIALPLRIEVIKNGILVHHGSGMDHFGPRAPGTEIEYAQDQAGAEAIVLRILRRFLVSAFGTPVPEAGKGLPGASPGMVRLPGPPPVSGPLEGPLEP